MAAGLVIVACSDAGVSTDAGADSTSTSGVEAPTTGTTTTEGGADSSSTTTESSGADTSTSTDTSSGSADTTVGDTEGACGIVEMTDDTTGESGDDESTGDTGGDACPSEGDLGAAPALVRGNLDGSDDFSGACGNAGIPEAEFTFTAPSDGVYHFDADSAIGPVVVYALDGICGGADLDCGESVSLVLTAGQIVTLVAEPLSLENAHPGWTPWVELAAMPEMACPIADLGSMVPQTTYGSAENAPGDLDTACGFGTIAPDVAFTFTAPADDVYSFVATPSAYDPIIVSVLDGSCDGLEIDCASAGATNVAAVSVPLVADQTVTVVVTGVYETTDEFHFTLDIDTLADQLTCPIADLGGSVPQAVTGSTLFTGDDFERYSAAGPYPDAEYVFTPAQDGVYAFDTAGSEYQPTLYVLDGECQGALVADDDGATWWDARAGLAVELEAGTPVTIVVDGSDFYTATGGDYRLGVDRLDGECPEEDLCNAMPPFEMHRDTSTNTNSTAGSCGGFLEPDHAVTWTAPEAGTYLVSTRGSGFDTVVYVRDASCGGDELACNDGHAEDVEAYTWVTLAAGQTVVIVVDGRAGGAGEFVLRIEQQEPSSCCTPAAAPGCAEPSVEHCVCDWDQWCCTDEWEAFCVTLASEMCGAACPGI
jgi:hypothetical protein